MISPKIIRSIENIDRFSGSHLSITENIMSHSGEMALLCINFSYLVKESDVKEMCYRCIIHDLEESVACDVPRPLKHYSKDTKLAIDYAANQLLSEEVDSELMTEIINAKDTNNVNGLLVHMADRIQCLLKMSREVHLYGNRSLARDLEKFKSEIHRMIDNDLNTEILSEESIKNLSNYMKELVFTQY